MHAVIKLRSDRWRAQFDADMEKNKRLTAEEVMAKFTDQMADAVGVISRSAPADIKANRAALRKSELAE